MKNLSLKNKIILVAIIPTLCFIIASAIEIRSLYLEMSDAQQTAADMKMVEVTVALVRVIQTERGLSAAILNGSGNREKFDDNRAKINTQIDQLKTALEKAKSSRYEKIGSGVEEYLKLRGKVDGRSITPEDAIKEYTSAIGHLLDYAHANANLTSFADVALALQNAEAITQTREMAGQLRARFNLVLTRNTATSVEMLGDITTGVAGLRLGLANLNHHVAPEVPGKVETILNSPEIARLRNAANAIVRKADTGIYGLEAQSVFTDMTFVLEKIGEATTSQYAFTAKMVESHAEHVARLLFLHVCGLVGLMTILAIGIPVFTRSLARSMAEVIDNLRARYEAVAAAGEQIRVASIDLAESTTELASSVQETVSSVNEIESMVQKNADSAGQCETASDESSQTAARGKTAVDDMIQAIGAISSSNDAIVGQVVDGNKKLSEILRVIAEIGEKTKVINDIVFQTKLLSFNASVEAARAGEHGKGFAVVAEEVGNLAQMSGTAAKEISAMLEDGMGKVNRIVQDTNSKVDTLVDSAKKTIDQGLSRARECEAALDQITASVGNVRELVSVIASSSKEQSAGVREINNAMQEIDTVTQKNSQIANESTNSASELNGHSEALKNVVQELLEINSGRGAQVVEHKEPVAKVLKMKKKSAPKENTKVIAKPTPQLKKAAGHGGTPSSDDSGFVDV